MKWYISPAIWHILFSCKNLVLKIAKARDDIVGYFSILTLNKLNINNLTSQIKASFKDADLEVIKTQSNLNTTENNSYSNLLNLLKYLKIKDYKNLNKVKILIKIVKIEEFIGLK